MRPAMHPAAVHQGAPQVHAPVEVWPGLPGHVDQGLKHAVRVLPAARLGGHDNPIDSC